MAKKIPQRLRKATAARAGYRCEYCCLPAEDSFYGFHIDHIVSRKHNGKTVLENLALACPDCNDFKGSDLVTILEEGGDYVRFFNPRTDAWVEHFEIDESGIISSKTDIGEATVRVFNFNHPDRIIERKLLWQLGLLP